MEVPQSSFTFLLLALACSTSKGSKLVYHNDASLPDELDLMELYIGEPPAQMREMVKRAEQTAKNTNGLWFGPRLGRKKRSFDVERPKRELDEASLMAKEEMIRLSQEWPWAYMSFKGGKRRNASNFIPRLGRDSEEDLIENFEGPSYEGYSRTNMRSGGSPSQNSLGSNFTPRLGRLAPISQH